MSKKLYTESDIEDIADAIREKNGSNDTYKVAEMSAAIRSLPTGGGGDFILKRFSYIGDGGEPNTKISFVGKETPIIVFVVGHQSFSTLPFVWGNNYYAQAGAATYYAHVIQYIDDGKTMRLSGYPNSSDQILNYPNTQYDVYYLVDASQE